MSTRDKIILILGICVLGLLFTNGYSLYRIKHLSVPEFTKTITDTVVQHSVDTIKITNEKIVYKDRIILDSVFVQDTLVVELKVYEDSLSTIYISGILPEIDSILYRIPRDSIFIETTIEKRFVDKKRVGLVWCIGPYAGYGVNINKNGINTGVEFGICGSIGIGGIIK